MSEFTKYEFLEKAITIKFPKEWKLFQKDENAFEIKFPHGPYPVLGCYLNCFDGPKLNSEEKIQEYLLGDNKTSSNLKKKGDRTFFLDYQFNAKNEKLMMWKILNYIEPRSFREVRFSLAWPDTKDANSLVEKIIKDVKKVIEILEFSNSKTEYDNLGAINYKLQNIKLKKYNFWDALNIYFPERWLINYDNDNNTVNLLVSENDNFYLFFEFFKINLKNNNQDNDLKIKTFLEEITRGVNVINESLIKADDSNYIFSFSSNENHNGDIIINRISYRLNIKDTNLLIVSFVFSYNKDQENIGKTYFNKVYSLIKSSELN